MTVPPEGLGTYSFESFKGWVDKIKEITSTRCSKCKEDFPHAEARVGFKCWGCRNGY